MQRSFLRTVGFGNQNVVLRISEEKGIKKPRVNPS